MNVVPNSGIKEYAGVSYKSNFCSFDDKNSDYHKYSIVTQTANFEKNDIKKIKSIDYNAQKKFRN